MIVLNTFLIINIDYQMVLLFLACTVELKSSVSFESGDVLFREMSLQYHWTYVTEREVFRVQMH